MANDLEEKKQNALLIKAYQNVAVCNIKLKKPERACIAIQEMERLTTIKNMTKALFIKGKAKMMLYDYDLARRYFEMSYFLKPKDKMIENALKELDRLEKEKAKYEARVAAQKLQNDILMAKKKIYLK